MSFTGKVVIVTGGSSGIGASIAIKFAQEGARVAIVGRNQEKLNNVAKKCSSALVIVADVTKDEDVKRIIGETVKHFGKLDVLINNAGIGLSITIQDENTMAAFDKIMSTNLRSVVYLTHLAVPHLVKTKGNIINISSIAALQVASGNLISYSTSKAALDHFSRCTASELASSGIRVNVVNPGPVRTDILQNLGASEEQQKVIFDMMKKSTALGRISEPDEIADIVLFLAHEKAKAITGSTFVSDNGSLVKAPEVIPLVE